MEAQSLAANTAAWYSAVASAGFQLPANLVPSNTLDLTNEDKADMAKFTDWARTTAADINDWNARTEMAFVLYLDQRKRARTMVIGAGLLAAILGGVMGYYVGRPKVGG